MKFLKNWLALFVSLWVAWFLVMCTFDLLGSFIAWEWGGFFFTSLVFTDGQGFRLFLLLSVLFSWLVATVAPDDLYPPTE